MALQKKNNLLRAHLVVGVFWFTVLFIAVRGFDLKAFAGRTSFAMMVMFLGVLCGVALWVAVDMSRKNGVLSKSGAHGLRGLNSTIGEIPVAQEPNRGAVREDVFTRRFPWWAAYRDKHPAPARAMRAVLSVMSSNPTLPASPVPGGHGGATLIEHSLNVVDTMLQMAPKWSYRGHKNKKGEISFPLLDNTRIEHRFSPDDPIVPLAAFAHDIGKVTCYRLDGNSITEVRKNHDIEGAKLLRSLPEIMSLSWKDRMALLAACEFYHHIGSMPHSTWIDDRARSLVELLITADVATGRREGGVVADEHQDNLADISSSEPSPEPSAENNGEAADEDVVASDSLSVASSAAAYGTALDLAYSALLEPGRVNGTNATTRVAWKHGEWLYINDARLRSVVADRTGDSGYNALPHRGNMHTFTLDLMAQLAAGGNLLQEHEGHKFSEKRAIYTTTSAVPGKTPVESRFVIVARVGAFPGLENAADCKVQPVVVRCSWGETAAVNKKGECVVIEDNKTFIADNEFLLEAASSMKVPYVEKSVDGEDYLFFEEDVLRQEFPDRTFDDPAFIRKTGAESGKIFLGMRKVKYGQDH